MIEISRAERDKLLKHFRKTEIHSTKHKYFAAETPEIMRELHILRGERPQERPQTWGGVRRNDRPYTPRNAVRGRFSAF